MPRSSRAVLIDYPNHVVQRGNNRQPIFHEEADYSFYLYCLKQAQKATSCILYAYCLMANHVHLLIQPVKPTGLARFMQSVGRRYVLYFNRKYGRTGTLWEGRFKSSLIEGDLYLAACTRYIELNPVRAGVTAHPKAYRWSSYSFHAEGQHDPLLDLDPWYLALASVSRERQDRYRDFVTQGIPSEELTLIREAVQRGGITGGHGFSFDDLTARLGRVVVLRPRGRPRQVEK